jgi:hypothetical protein
MKKGDSVFSQQGFFIFVLVFIYFVIALVCFLNTMFWDASWFTN